MSRKLVSAMFHKQDVFEKLGYTDIDSMRDEAEVIPGPSVRERVTTILEQTKVAGEELVDHKEAKRIAKKAARKVAKEVRDATYPSALEGVQVTRRFVAKQKANKKQKKDVAA